MKEIEDYQVVSATIGFSMKRAVTQLTLDVNEALKRGWKPIGGISVVSTQLMQAMVRSR
tara:strand:- start:2027 stop:2203 length:177 start_codon:yes stop_codon:yes gene_type:complete